MDIDIRIENHGSIVLLRPVSTAAAEWLEAVTGDDAQTWCGATAVEPRYLSDILDGALDEGFVLAH